MERTEPGIRTKDSPDALHIASADVGDSAKITLTERAYQALTAMIRSRELRSGDPLFEVKLAEKMGVSRTPFRQALQRLEGDGLLQKNSSRSFIVRKVDLKEYLQSLRVRETLEPKAAFLATGNIAKASILKSLDNQRNVQKLKPYDMVKHWNSDCEVHDLFIRNCGNEVMTHILLRLRITTELFEIDRLSDRLDQVSREHEKILDALLKDDAAGARRAVKSHIRSLFGFALQAVG